MRAAEKIRDSVECRHCQSQMEVLKIKKHSGKWPYVLVVTGVLCSLFFTGILVGIPMLLLGIYMATAEETISHCPNCGHYFQLWTKADVTGHGG